MNIAIRPARPDEAGRLSELALRSKAHWGYDAALMASFREELTISAERVVRVRTQVAVAQVEPGAGAANGVEERILGFGTLEGAPPAGELGMLFVDPEMIGRGVGGALFKHVTALATELGFHRLTIASDPSAEPFYLAQGAARIGSVPSGSIPGRSLPLLAFAL